MQRILDLATHVLGQTEKASLWLTSESRALDGEVPLRMLDTDIGTQRVQHELRAIEFGMPLVEVIPRRPWTRPGWHRRALHGSTLACVLRVPSVIVPEECNLVLNPLHPEAIQMSLIRARPFRFRRSS